MFRPSVLFFLFFLTGSLNAATLEFITPDGIVGPTDPIEVRVRLSTPTGLMFDLSDPDGDGSFGGLDPIYIPTMEFVPEANGGAGAEVPYESFFFAGTNTAFTCSGSFAGGGGSVCPPGDNYTFTFNLSGETFNFLDTYALGAGETDDFLFGTFMPLGGGAANGTYDFFWATFFFMFEGEGMDDDGEMHELESRIDLAVTCATGDTTCDFTRTVVPLPGAFVLFLPAIIGLFGSRFVRKTPL